LRAAEAGCSRAFSHSLDPKRTFIA
jgi:hypothetical protein